MRKMRKDWTQQALLRTGIEDPKAEGDGAPAGAAAAKFATKM
jgi:hypothetical protein